MKPSERIKQLSTDVAMSRYNRERNREVIVDVKPVYMIEAILNYLDEQHTLLTRDEKPE